MKPSYYECGTCGHAHRIGYGGDCRNDAERFTFDALDVKHGTEGIDYDLLRLDDNADGEHPTG